MATSRSVALGCVLASCAVLGCGDLADGDAAAAGDAGGGQVAGLPDPDVGPRPAACAPGELAVDGSCVPAGVPPEMCGAGFASDGVGGCVAPLPPRPCAPGEMALVGETRCRPVAACGAGAWGDIPVEPDTQYVDASYLVGNSDGSSTKPWPSIQAAIDAAAPGAIVAIAAGSYPEDVLIEGKPVRLWGKCPAETELGGDSSLTGVVDVRPGAEGTEIRNLAVTNGPVGIAVDGLEGVLVEEVWIHDTTNLGMMAQDFPNPTTATLRKSLIEAATGIGVFVWGSTVTVENSIVRDTVPSGVFGRGINGWLDPDSQRPSTVIVKRSIVSRSPGYGIVGWGADIVVDDTLVSDTRPLESDLSAGFGIHASSDFDNTQPGSLVVRSSLVEQSHGAGVFIFGSTLTAEALVVRDTAPFANAQNYGHGVDLTSVEPLGTMVSTIRSSLIERHHRGGIVAHDASLTAEGVIVREVVPASDGLYGTGISLQDGGNMQSRLAVRGSVVERVHSSGIVIAGAPLTVDSTLVRDVEPDELGQFGHGIDAVNTAARPAHLAASHLLVERTSQVGVMARGSTFAIDSIVVREVRQNPGDTNAWGIYVGMDPNELVPASGSVSYVLVEDLPGLGMGVIGEIRATIEGAWIRGLEPSSISDGIGAGSSVSASASYLADVSIRGCRIEGSPRAGISSFGARVTLADSLLWCNLIDLDAETWIDVAPEFNDEGGNGCACDDGVRICKALSSQLDAPTAPPVQEP